MRFQTKLTVIGLKSSKGTLDNGQSFDSTKAFVLVPLDDRKGRMRGNGVNELNIGDADEYDKFAKVPVPFEATADVELVTSGSTQRTVVHSLVPVAAADAKPGAK